MVNFGYLGVSSSLHDAASVDRMLAELADNLQNAGGTPTADPGLDAPLAIVVLTGGTEQAVLQAASARPDREPVIVVAHPWHNSLPAALEAVARLHQDGRPARIAVLDGGQRSVAGLAAAAADVAVARELHRLTIGVVGTPSDWLVASCPTPEAVRAAWGPKVIAVDIDDTIARYQRTAADAGTALADAMVTAAGQVDEPVPGAVAAAAQVHPVLRDLVREHHLDALTIRCFDLVTRLGTTGCLALAELNDAGVTAGCEGDLPSTIAMLWTRLVTGQVPWMANPSQVRLDEELLVLAHCTVPRSLTTGYRIESHFESGLGAALTGDLPAGPVTLVRIGGRDLRRHWITDAEAVEHPHQDGLCRTQLAVRLPAVAIE